MQLNLASKSINGTDEDDLVRAVQQGDDQALEPLLDLHLSHVRAFLALRSPVPNLVDELAHETFVYAYHNIHKFSAGTSFRAWLLSIAWNRLRAEVQRFSREQAHQYRFAQFWLSELEDQQAARHVSRQADFLAECVEQMPTSMQDLLILKYHKEESTEEIARRLQRSLVWVRTVLFRVRQQLKDCIEGKAGKDNPC